MRFQTSRRVARGVATELMPSSETPRRMKGMTVVLQVGAAREPDARDVAPEVHGAREPGEELAPDVVDRAGPERLLERAGAQVDL